MAYTAGNLHLRAGAPGDLSYNYDAGSDSLATVIAAGYFNNADDDLNLTADDLVWVQANDGNMWLRVSSIDSGSAVTTQFAGGNLPVRAAATGTVAERATLEVGYTEIGSATTGGDCTASRYILPTPYAGAEIKVSRSDSGTLARHFDAGGSATGETGVTYNAQGERRIELKREGEGFHVVGISASRWQIQNLNFHATGASASAGAGASAVLPGT